MKVPLFVNWIIFFAVYSYISIVIILVIRLENSSLMEGSANSIFSRVLNDFFP
jgi:hypothetical protein